MFKNLVQARASKLVFKNRVHIYGKYLNSGARNKANFQG
jgi:hypothetical protein